MGVFWAEAVHIPHSKMTSEIKVIRSFRYMGSSELLASARIVASIAGKVMPEILTAAIGLQMTSISSPVRQLATWSDSSFAVSIWTILLALKAFPELRTPGRDAAKPGRSLPGCPAF